MDWGFFSISIEYPQKPPAIKPRQLPPFLNDILARLKILLVGFAPLRKEQGLWIMGIGHVIQE